MGVGIGGDYPLSAVISSEFSSTRYRGRLMTAVFAAQGWGNFSAFSSLQWSQSPYTSITAAALVALIVVSAYKNSMLKHDTPTHLAHVDYMWLLLIGMR